MEGVVNYSDGFKSSELNPIVASKINPAKYYQIDIRTFIRTSSTEVVEKLKELQRRKALHLFLTELIESYFNGTFNKIEIDGKYFTKEALVKLIRDFESIQEEMNRMKTELENLKMLNNSLIGLIKGSNVTMQNTGINVRSHKDINSFIEATSYVNNKGQVVNSEGNFDRDYINVYSSSDILANSSKEGDKIDNVIKQAEDVKSINDIDNIPSISEFLNL